MKLTWQHVIVIGLVLSAVVTLALAGQDINLIITFGGLILTATGISVVAGQLPGLRDQANGRISELLTLVRDMAERLAESQPAPKKE